MLHALAIALAVTAAACGQDFPVRSSDARVRAAVISASSRSTTMRRLIATLYRRQAIVYVKWSPALPPLVRGAIMPRVTVTGQARYLWVALNPDRVSDELVALIAHELQHALEILDAEVTDPAAIGAMYQSLDGASGRHVYDTAEARSVGLQVERELKASTAAPYKPKS